MRCLWLWLILSLAMPLWTVADGDSSTDEEVYDKEMAAHNAKAAWVDTRYQQDVKKFAGNADVVVKRGLVASRKDKTVQIYASATGLGPGNPIEFYLIGEKSSHAYEALAIAYADPADVRQALIFIGMQPGRTVDYDKLMFWPKGERVKVSVTGVGDNHGFGPVNLVNMLWDYEQRRSTSPDGFVFTGSVMVDDKDNPAEKLVGAAQFDPFSIISDYNEPVSVLDIAMRSTKGDAYGDNTVNTNLLQNRGALLSMVMRPEYADGQKRVINFSLTVLPGDSSATNAVISAAFDMVNTDNATTNHYQNLAELSKALKNIITSGHDPFVTLHFSPDLRLSDCHKLSAFFSGIETTNGIRVEPPQGDELFYLAFVPNERMRIRKNRYVQPLELHLRLLADKLDATIVKVDEIWGASNTPTLRPKLFPVALHGGLEQTVKDTGVKMKILLIFADGNIRLGQLMNYIKPLRSSYELVHVYLEKPGTKLGPAK